MDTTDRPRKKGRPGALLLHPACGVIERCGGVDAVAKMTGRHPSRVRRWTFPKERGGTDGLIPFREGLKIRNATEAGTDPITADDLSPSGDNLSRNDLAVLLMLAKGDSIKTISVAMRVSQRATTAQVEALRRCPRISNDAWGLIDRKQGEGRSP